MTNQSSLMPIETYFGTDSIARDSVHQWESRRAKAVLNKLRRGLGPHGIAELAPDQGIDALLVADLTTQRAALTDLKMKLGHGGIYALLGRELALSERFSRALVTASRGRSKHCVVRLVVPNYPAQAFADWFDNLTIESAQVRPLRAAPSLPNLMVDSAQDLSGGTINAEQELVAASPDWLWS